LTDLRQTRDDKKIPKTILKTESKLKKPLKQGIFRVSGIFIEDYLRNLTCWEKSKYRFGINAPKLSKNR
jgi:hypothetical protein